MRRATAVIVLAVLAAPAAATDSFTGTLVADYLVEGMPTGVVAQRTDNYNVTLARGDAVAATLAWVPAVEENDLDLVLLLPSAAPVPVAVDPGDPDALTGSAPGVAATRVARATCTDAAATAAAHDGGTAERLALTVPDAGEAGVYVLNVRGFVLLTDQPYSLAVTVTRAGADVVGAVEKDAGQTTFLTAAPYCQTA